MNGRSSLSSPYPSTGSGQAGRTDWKDTLRQAQDAGRMNRKGGIHLLPPLWSALFRVRLAGKGKSASLP
ncbi:MAG: hypothetical protein LBD67_09635 [Candidatus Accumulibacter sp.]|nr:hypothetical protein [Accumulibacter sp.]